MTVSANAAVEQLRGGHLTGEWVLNPAESTVKLKTKAMFGMVPVKGTFGTLSGSATVGDTGDVRATINVAADSLSTKMKKRDEHLRSADFFDADQHPQLVVDIRELGPDLIATGTLTVEGVSTKLSFPVTVAESSASKVAIDAVFTVDRSEVGIDFKKMGATKMLSTMTVHASFTKS